MPARRRVANRLRQTRGSPESPLGFTFHIPELRGGDRNHIHRTTLFHGWAAHALRQSPFLRHNLTHVLQPNQIPEERLAVELLEHHGQDADRNRRIAGLEPAQRPHAARGRSGRELPLPGAASCAPPGVRALVCGAND